MKAIACKPGENYLVSMHRLILIISIVCLVLPLSGYCNNTGIYPEVITPQPLYFDVNLPAPIEEYKVLDVAYTPKSGSEDKAQLILVDGNVHLAVYYSYYDVWDVSRQLFPGIYHTYSLAAVGLDDDGRYELLVKAVKAVDEHTDYTEHLLVNFDKEYAFRLVGPCTGGLHSNNVPGSGISVWPGKVIFDFIDGNECLAAGFDTVGAVVYMLVNDTLYRRNYLPGFSNLSEPYNTNKVLKGNISGQSVTMYLNKAGKYYDGYYYYEENKGKPLKFHGRSFPDKTAPVVLEQYFSDTVFIGEVTDSSFIGKWTNGKKVVGFHLRGSYGKDMVRLRKYSFRDSVLWHNNARYDLYFSCFLADTMFVDKETAVALNTALFGDIGEQCYYQPQTVFREIRKGRYQYVNNEFFRDADGMKMDTRIEWSVTYNQNGLLCVVRYLNEYMGGAHPGHNTETVIFDARKKKELTFEDIFNCSDSLLCAIIREAHIKYAEKIGEKPDLHTLDRSCNKYMTVLLKPGKFSFFIHRLSTGEYIEIPFSRMEAYIQPEYRKRLMTVE